MIEEQAVEAIARAICQARGRNPDDCVMGSGSVTFGGAGSFECHRYAWQDEIGAAKAALSAALKEMAQGWRIVPVEPTDEMMVAAEDAVPSLACFAAKEKSPSYLAYRAMLAAAEEPK